MPSSSQTQNPTRLSVCSCTVRSEQSVLSIFCDANDNSNRRHDNDRGVMGHGFGPGPPPVHCLTRQVLVVLSRGEVTCCVELSRDRGVGFCMCRNSTCLCTAPQFTPSAYILLTPPPPVYCNRVTQYSTMCHTRQPNQSALHKSD
jgi:hypothetical protein